LVLLLSKIPKAKRFEAKQHKNLWEKYNQKALTELHKSLEAIKSKGLNRIS
jgi:hypothetical protein